MGGERAASRLVTMWFGGGVFVDGITLRALRLSHKTCGRAVAISDASAFGAADGKSSGPDWDRRDLSSLELEL
jgi:hypothetical protein